MAISAATSQKGEVKKYLLEEMKNDIEFMIENEASSDFLSKQPEMSVDMALNKLKDMFNVDPNMDLEQEYELIVNKKSKVSSNMRTIISFLVLANKYKDIKLAEVDTGSVKNK